MDRIVLFDVDNTLLYSGGAGGLAMDRVFEELFGIERGVREVTLAGRTDRAIVRDVLARHGLLEGSFPQVLDRFKETYLRHLATMLPETSGYVMPGVPELLAALEEEDGVGLGLATGNFQRAAMMKLEFYGLDRFFSDGGFGDESEDRAVVVREAIRRVAGDEPPGGGPAVWVIGDTVLDIASARPNGARVLAVATGLQSLEMLREAGPDALFEDLSDTGAVLEALLG